MFHAHETKARRQGAEHIKMVGSDLHTRYQQMPGSHSIVLCPNEWVSSQSDGIQTSVTLQCSLSGSDPQRWYFVREGRRNN